jgi:chromate transporter
MLNLALFFAYHVLWPQGWNAPFETTSAVLTLACLLALMRMKWSVLGVLTASAAVGLLLYGQMYLSI